MKFSRIAAGSVLTGALIIGGAAPAFADTNGYGNGDGGGKGHQNNVSIKQDTDQTINGGVHLNIHDSSISKSFNFDNFGNFSSQVAVAK